MNEQTNNPAFDLSIDNKLAPYLATLSLNTLPFSANIPGSKLFIDPDRQQSLDQLSHLVQSSDMILVVAGESGSGKTTLLHQFKKQATSNLKCCTITADVDYTEQDIWSSLSRCLDLPDNLNSQVMYELINEQITALHRSDVIPVILIDNAFKLPKQTLNALLYLQQNESPCRIVLFTQPSHSPELIQLKDRLHFIQIPGLTLEQTKQYLTHRLSAAGFKGESPFSDKDLILIQKRSEGNLTKIHQQAHEILLDKVIKPGTQSKPIEQKINPLPIFLKPSTVIFFIVIIAIGTVLFYQAEINQLIQETPPKNTELKKEVIALPSSPVKLSSIPDKNTINWETIPALTISKKTTPQRNVTTQIKDPAEETAHKNITEKPVELNKQNNSTITAPNLTKKTTPENITLKTLLDKYHIKGKNWILKQNESAATAQIMASSKPDILIKNATSSALKDKAAIYHIMRNNKDWYVLIYGNSQTKALMKNEILSIPSSLQKSSPWVRPFKDIQIEIKAGKK